MKLCESFDHIYLEHLSTNTAKLRNPDSSEEEKRIGEAGGKWLQENPDEMTSLINELHSENLPLKDFYGISTNKQQ